jgi:MarR family transcriptional regulator, negative regulator of the multidrug operon emrRAB
MQNITLFSSIERIGSLIRAEERKKCTALGLQSVHLQALTYLALCNRYSNTPAALANYLGMTRGTISQTLLLLEKKGLIKKASDPNDKRIVRVVLSPSGHEILEQAGRADLFRRAQGYLENEGLSDCELIIEKVLTALQLANDTHTFGLCQTCRHYNAQNDHFVCGLTREILTKADSEKICQEHSVSREENRI